VFVVNQGPKFLDEELINNIQSDSRIRIIEQNNLGGCGGFTRTLVEAAESDLKMNYHLLMDDDIVIDPRVIKNCVNFLSNTEEEVVLGGSMLDSLRPDILYEAGARLKSSNAIESLMHNVHVGDCRTLSAFAEPMHVDFNAWWFCAIPLSAVLKVNYPAPIFIRGDDFEFGIRLGKNGYETVSLPGIAVWHEPFYAKPPGWQQYYDLRNRLIFAACHDDSVKIQSPNHLLRHALLEPLLTHNYQTLLLNLQAIEDFLAGPNMLFSTAPNEKHAEVVGLFGTERAESLTRQKAQALEYLSSHRSNKKKSGVKAGYIGKLIRSSFMKSANGKPQGILMDVDVRSDTVGNRSYVMTNGVRSFHLLFSPDRKKFFYYLRRIFKAHSRYRSELKRSKLLWKDGITAWRDRSVWEHLFARNP